jgi:hypothetical protein
MNIPHQQRIVLMIDDIDRRRDALIVAYRDCADARREIDEEDTHGVRLQESAPRLINKEKVV